VQNLIKIVMTLVR